MKRFLPTDLPNLSNSSQDKNFVYGSLSAVWLVAVAFGLWGLMSYANRPGDQGQPVATWPEAIGIERSNFQPTLVLFAHPKCPCTRATLGELAWLMNRCADDLDCHVLFFRPGQQDDSWSKTRLWDEAAAIRGVSVAADPDAQLASQFGVRTSGHALLYDPQGKLVFEGGITGSRGHRGDNPGRSAVLSLVGEDHVASGFIQASGSKRSKQHQRATCSSCVFGCPLRASQVALRALPAGAEG